VSAKAACVIPTRWTLEDYAQHTCSDRSHGHLSKTELADNRKHGLIEVLREEHIEIVRHPVRRRIHHRAVVRIVRTLAARGLSCSVGSRLVIALGDPTDRGWALVMLAQIRKRREARTKEDDVE